MNKPHKWEIINALKELRDEYEELVESGDCGFYDPSGNQAYENANEILKRQGVEDGNSD